jgi:hypothetical protein
MKYKKDVKHLFDSFKENGLIHNYLAPNPSPRTVFDKKERSISLSHAAIFGWHFSRGLRDKST